MQLAGWILLGVFVVLTCLFAGLATSKEKLWSSVSYTAAALGALACALTMAFVQGARQWWPPELKENAIYEVVCSEENSGRYYTFLREQDGDVVAFTSDKPLPRVFKETEGGPTPYPTPYPELPVDRM